MYLIHGFANRANRKFNLDTIHLRLTTWKGADTDKHYDDDCDDMALKIARILRVGVTT